MSTTQVSAPQRDRYRRLVRASAWYDLVVTAGFATPWTFALVRTALNGAGDAFGLGTLPEPDAIQVLYANLMGSVVVVWSLLRLLRTERFHGLYDGAARVLFTVWMAYALSQGAPDLLWPFVILEALWGLAQLLPWLRRGGVARGR